MSKADIRRQRTEELEGLLYDLAFHAERQETQVSAATKLHAISDFDTLIRNNVYYQQLTARRKSLGTTSTTLSGFA